MIRASLLCLALLMAGFDPAAADVPMSGTLTATEACPAWQSFRRQTNPGEASVAAGASYRVTARNADPARFYLVMVAGAQPAQRWVEARCFGASAPAAGGVPATHVLSLSWEPQFCAGHRDRAECAGASGRRLGLHGLWPQPIGRFYCGVTDRALIAADARGQWDALPEPVLSPSTQALLQAWMPGAQSGLQRHEWIKHGTCFGGSADAYFRRAVQLAEQVNQSGVLALFERSAGQSLPAEAIRQAFDAAFGAGAGLRVTVSCSRGPRPRIAEMVIALAGDVAGTAPVGALMQAAAPVPEGCPAGTVVPPQG